MVRAACDIVLFHGEVVDVVTRIYDAQPYVGRSLRKATDPLSVAAILGRADGNVVMVDVGYRVGLVLFGTVFVNLCRVGTLRGFRLRE